MAWPDLTLNRIESDWVGDWIGLGIGLDWIGIGIGFASFQPDGFGFGWLDGDCRHLTGSHCIASLPPLVIGRLCRK